MMWTSSVKKVLSHLLIEQSDLDVAERRHFLQTADRRDCSFAVEHLAADTVQVISGHLAGGDQSRVHKTCQKLEDVVDDLQHVHLADEDDADDLYGKDFKTMSVDLADEDMMLWMILTMSIWLMKCSGFLRWPWANTWWEITVNSIPTDAIGKNTKSICGANFPKWHSQR